MLAILREQSLCLIIGHAGVDNNIFTLLPVDGGSDAMFVASLESCLAKRSKLKNQATRSRELGGSYNQSH